MIFTSNGSAPQMSFRSIAFDLPQRSFVQSIVDCWRYYLGHGGVDVHGLEDCVVAAVLRVHGEDDFMDDF